MGSSEPIIYRVAAEGGLLAGAGRAILLQVAHPAVAAGVANHSRFATDPLGRLRGTLTYIYAVVFGTDEEVERAADVVAAKHRYVRGPGYDASDPDLQIWVAATLYDSALTLYREIYGPLDDVDSADCLRQYAILANALGTPETKWPSSPAEFNGYWSAQLNAITVSDQARSIAGDLLWPKLPVVLRPGIPVYRFVTIGLLPEPIRKQYGFGWTPADARRFARGMRVATAVYRKLPDSIRRLPMRICLATLRRTGAGSEPGRHDAPRNRLRRTPSACRR